MVFSILTLALLSAQPARAATLEFLVTNSPKISCGTSAKNPAPTEPGQCSPPFKADEFARSAADGAVEKARTQCEEMKGQLKESAKNSLFGTAYNGAPPKCSLADGFYRCVATYAAVCETGPAASAKSQKKHKNVPNAGLKSAESSVSQDAKAAK